MCREPDTYNLRAYFDSAGFSDVRNRSADFMNTYIALDNSIGYVGKVAMTGSVDSLETYHPKTAPVERQDIEETEKAVPGIVQSGKLLTKAAPIYPPIAKMGRVSGTVVMCAVISKQGTISSLDVVASPDGSLSSAAMDAVKQWTYEPYLLNGKPVEVDTTITVNFVLGGL
jgi:TonB family protein